MTQNNIPQSAMVIVAHPDGAEFTVTGTGTVQVDKEKEIAYAESFRVITLVQSEEPEEDEEE